MALLPTPTEAEILERVGEQSFDRAVSYFRGGAVYDLRRQGRTLKARCEGSRAEAYRLWVRFGEQGIEEADCSCPVGAGGYCKHTAALLLTWRAKPEAFVELEELEPVLARRSKEELIALIQQMLRREPDLEVLLETPLPVAGGAARRMPLDPEVYRRQAQAAFRALDYDDPYDPVAEVVDRLDTIVQIGDGFRDQGDSASAAVVYRTVLETVLAHSNTFPDEEGELSGVIQECAAGLGACLPHLPPGEARDAVLRALFDVVAADVAAGGVGLSDTVPETWAAQATLEERQRIAGWVREALAKDRAGAPGPMWGVDYRAQWYGGLLLDLEAETLDDEAFLRICRETGRAGDAVDRLLSLGRVEEAIAETKDVGDYQLLALADLFAKHGQPELAEQLVRERTRTTQDTRLFEWLKARLAARGDVPGALDLAVTIFRHQPTFGAYQEARQLARDAGRWDALRPQLLDHLTQRGLESTLLQIHLDEGEIDQALAMVKSVRSWAFGYGFGGSHGPDLRIEVARAAESSRPEAALEIYRRYAEGLIDQRHRTYYRQAAELLKRMRTLHKRLGQQGEWERYIAGLRERHRTLRALKDELASAGL